MPINPTILSLSDSDLRTILLTVDGKGKMVKEDVLDELIAREAKRRTPIVDGPYQFQLDDSQREKLEAWLTNHDKTCWLAQNSGAIGGRLTVCFTPTSIDTFTTVKCGCGQKISLTDFDKI